MAGIPSPNLRRVAGSAVPGGTPSYALLSLSRPGSLHKKATDFRPDGHSRARCRSALAAGVFHVLGPTESAAPFHRSLVGVGFGRPDATCTSHVTVGCSRCCGIGP